MKKKQEKEHICKDGVCEFNTETDSEECNCHEECNCGSDCECEDCHCNDADLEKLVKQVEILSNELLKSKADFINYRKRLDDERMKDLKYCNEELVLEILPIIDNFERAIKLDDTDLSDELSKFLEGFKMIYCNLLNIVKKFGVIEIDGFNKPFNPTYHQAVLTEKVNDVESGFVVEVLQKGYILKDKVIRPAMVKVSE